MPEVEQRLLQHHARRLHVQAGSKLQLQERLQPCLEGESGSHHCPDIARNERKHRATVIFAQVRNFSAKVLLFHR